MATKVISFSGKGGVGKSSLIILLLKYLLEIQKYKNILLIDADPDANIGDMLGKKIEYKQTVGGKMAVLKSRIQNMSISPDVPKNQIIESEVFDALIETDQFDILEMGRGEGSGCYCSVNNALKSIIDVLAKNYDIVLIDAPAGLEFFSRKTGREVTDLVIVSDGSKMGLETLERIIEVSKEVELKFKNIWILGNKFPLDLKELLEKKVEKLKQKNVQLLGVLPIDEEISRINLIGQNLLDISNNNKLYVMTKNLYQKIL